jgi:lysophospholipase L1-like esterase
VREGGRHVLQGGDRQPLRAERPADAAREAVRFLGIIRRAVAHRRGFRYVGLVDTFRGHPSCNDDADDWINDLHLTDTGESFHPNEAGQRAIARRLAAVAPRFFR